MNVVSLLMVKKVLWIAKIVLIKPIYDKSFNMSTISCKNNVVWSKKLQQYIFMQLLSTCKYLKRTNMKLPFISSFYNKKYYDYLKIVTFLLIFKNFCMLHV